MRENATKSIETRSLHLDLSSDLERVNSHIGSIAYPILELAGALSKARIRHSHFALLAADATARHL